MKLLLILFLGILGLNAVLILSIVVILVLDRIRLRRKEATRDVSAEPS